MSDVAVACLRPSLPIGLPSLFFAIMSTLGQKARTGQPPRILWQFGGVEDNKSRGVPGLTKEGLQEPNRSYFPG